MIRSLITIVTLLATGAHAILGCCLHHEHGRTHAFCEADHAPATQASAPSHACGCRHHGQADSSSERQDATAANVPAEGAPCGHQHHHGNGDCDEGHCQYLTNAKVELPALDGHTVFAGLVSTLLGPDSLAADQLSSLPPFLSASLLSGSFSVRDLTQIARI